MSASSQKMLSKNRPEEKRKTFIFHLAEVKRKNNYGVAISLKASSKRKMTLCVYWTVLVHSNFQRVIITPLVGLI